MTDKLSGYSTTPASNNAASPDGWPEGMTAGSVNNSDREFAARVREFYEDSQWIDYGHTIVSSTGSSIKLSGDVTAIYTAGRAIRVNQSASQDGWVSASAYSAPDTSITVTGFTVAAPTQVELGAVVDHTSLPNNLSITVASLATTGNVTVGGAMSITGAVNISGTLSAGSLSGIDTGPSSKCFVTSRGTNGTCTVANDTNITSVTRSAQGVYGVVFASNYGAANYVISGTAIYDGAGPLYAIRASSLTVSGFTAYVLTGGGVAVDVDFAFTCHGTLA